MAAGNLLISATILYSGESFAQFDCFCQVLKLKFLLEWQFHNIQADLLFPAVHSAWAKHNECIKGCLCGEPLQLAGDGRYDSAGFSAKYCSYFVVDMSTSRIVDYEQDEVTPAQSSTGIVLMCVWLVQQRALEHVSLLKYLSRFLVFGFHAAICIEIVSSKFRCVRSLCSPWYVCECWADTNELGGGYHSDAFGENRIIRADVLTCWP